MPATRTYSPLPPMIPAEDVFCADPYDPREPDPRPHTYGVRVCSCDAFATEPCRPTACTTHATNLSSSLTDSCSLVTYHCSLSNLVSTILHSSFLILNWSHTFSAKERDAETGLSYFGARYYSSDLSIWLSVDPMSDKYPSLSPYTYCANNPVKLVDPNGEEIFDDIVIHGRKNSSITIKTTLINLDLYANVDFGGNYSLNLENVAIGIQTEFVATGQAGIGTSYGGFKSKVMFFGGDYSGYWYDYIGGDMQLLCGASVEASIGIQTSLILGFYTGEKGGNTPESFAGTYAGLSCSAGIKAGICGVNFNASNTIALNNKWNIYTFGVSFTQGYQGGVSPTLGSEFGSAVLITKSIPTKERTAIDIIKNLLSH